MSNFSQRKLSRGEKTLIFVSLLALIALISAGQMRQSAAVPPSNATDAAKMEATTKSLISALRNGDQKQVQRLTTPKGFSSIQQGRRDKRFGSYQKLSTRLAEEWGDNPDWGFCLKPGQEGYGMSHGRFGKSDGGMMFKRAPKGWKVDNYKPSSEKTFKQYRRARNIQVRANAGARNTGR